MVPFRMQTSPVSPRLPVVGSKIRPPRMRKADVSLSCLDFLLPVTAGFLSPGKRTVNSGP